MKDEYKIVLAFIIAAPAVYYLGFWTTLGIIIIAGIVNIILE